MPLTWKSNYWIKQNESIETDTPELVSKVIMPLLRDAIYGDKIELSRRGIKSSNKLSIYYATPFIYFYEHYALWAIHKDMIPDKNNRISYFIWDNDQWRLIKDTNSEIK